MMSLLFMFGIKRRKILTNLVFASTSTKFHIRNDFNLFFSKEFSEFYLLKFEILLFFFFCILNWLYTVPLIKNREYITRKREGVENKKGNNK